MRQDAGKEPFETKEVKVKGEDLTRQIKVQVKVTHTKLSVLQTAVFKVDINEKVVDSLTSMI